MPTHKANINVSAKIIADISSGIYRTPANAMKELISNSFDADARSVVITTDYPDFNVITVSDNGAGMTVQKFEEVMSHIGGSDKRAVGEKVGYTKLGRPIIGKIGIGILAIAQISRKFTVISSTGEKPTRFEATIDLARFHEQEAYKYNLPDKHVMIGEYDVESDIEEDESRSYTNIVLEDIEDGFRHRLLDVPDKSIEGFKFKKGDPQTFAAFADWMKTRRVRDIPEYFRLLWELAIISPVPYLKNGPVPDNDMINDIKKRLLDYDFKVIVDGIPLLKPIEFPYEGELKKPYFDHKTYEIHFDEKVAGSRLKFSGYIYHRNVAIYPPELRGLLIRIRNVGIGEYDKSFLNFPQSAGPIIPGMTGEIYVEEGLEDALNIDRNSFRETDPHYLKLQEVVFTKLSTSRQKGGILADARYRSKLIQERKKRESTKGQYQDLTDTIEKATGYRFKIVVDDRQSDKPISIDRGNSEIRIFYRCLVYPKRAYDRELYEKFIIFHELSIFDSPIEPSANKLFYDLVRRERKI